MPEIAEVEIMSRQLNGWVRGRRLTGVETKDSAFSGRDWSGLVGRTVQAVRRRGKYALMHFQDGQTLVIHYRMTGKTVLDPERNRRARVWFDFGEPWTIAFVDTRRFGTLDILATTTIDDWFAVKKLGPEPWPELRSSEWWQERIGSVRSPIKVALMRQDRVAGLGNIAATEILFRAGIHPTRLASTLRMHEWARIATAVPAFITHTIAEEGDEELRYVNQGGEGSFAVYGKVGEACPRCGGEVARIVQSGRGTYFCPACQPLD